MKQTSLRRWSALATLWLAVASVAAEAPPPEGSPLAWIRFDDASQEYRGTRYLFLGDVELHLTFNVPVESGRLLQFLWGSKNDTREAELIANGRSQKLSHGGYDGFRWLSVAAPEGVTGDQYQVVLKLTYGKPAFLHEIRLATKEGGAGGAPDLKSTSHKATLKTVAVPGGRLGGRGEAFPDMREQWDREPAGAETPTPQDALFREAEKNARRAAEALYRCRRFVDGWLAYADPTSGLIPRNLSQGRDLWNARDSAADNYPFMVLTCALTDRPLFEGRMLDMLRAETRLTSRVDRLPDDFLFSRQGFAAEQVNFESIAFGASEYVKDGLLPLTEWLGPSPWSERALGLTEDTWKHAPLETPFGKLPTLNVEVGGDLLQSCSRLFWFTGDRRYLDWAIRLGDYYLLGNNHPTRDFDSLRLIDHGCEIVNGLSELYLAVSYAAPEKKREYQKPLHEMLDRILEVARNEHGQLYASVNPKTGEHAKGICDTWGYDYDAFYTTYLVDKVERYREAVLHVLGNLKEHYTGHNWGGSDGYADSLEGAINLYNREPIPSTGEWIDTEIRDMWGIQKSDGVIEGWHGDGNFARTTIMYALWRTQGLSVDPWRPDVKFGAVRDGEALCVSLAADEPWTGRVLFDKPRHRVNMRLPVDYPRINQFPEWFTTEAENRYTIQEATAGTKQVLTGKELQAGVPVKLQPGRELRWRVVR